MNRFLRLLFRIFSVAWLATSLALFWLMINITRAIRAHLQLRIDDPDAFSTFVLSFLITGAVVVFIYAALGLINARLLFRYTSSRTVSRIAKLYLAVFPIGSILGIFTLFLIQDAENAVAGRRRNH